MARPTDMSGLQAALDGAIDEIPEDGVAAKGVDLGAPDETAKGSEDESDPDKATPAPESENAAGEETPSPEGEDETEPEKDLLEGYSESKRKALLKFAPGGKISTAEELAAAEDKFVDDYWRNHTRLAEVARDEKPKDASPAAPEAKKEEVVRPEIQRYDTKLQTIVQEAGFADENIKGWQSELGKKAAEVNSLQRRLNSGDATVDANALLALYGECDTIRGHIASWQREWKKQDVLYSDTLARKSEVQTALDVKDRLDRQEKDAKDREQQTVVNQAQNQITSAVTHVTTLDKTTGKALVPAEEKVRFDKYLRFSINEYFRDNPETPIADLNVFATEVAKTFMGPVIKARTEAMAGYNKDKASDAPPKVIPQKKKPGAPASRDKKDGPASMADLESLVQGNSAWNS